MKIRGFILRELGYDLELGSKNKLLKKQNSILTKEISSIKESINTQLQDLQKYNKGLNSITQEQLLEDYYKYYPKTNQPVDLRDILTNLYKFKISQLIQIFKQL